MSLASPSVLIVDDSEDNRFTLSLLMEVEGYTNLRLVDNGTQAMRELSLEPADIVLLDIMMPGLDGYETLSLIKSDMALRHIPVIMISAVDEIDSVVRCLELGAEDYLSKPFNASVLRARMKSALSRKSMREQEARYLGQIEKEKQLVDQLLKASLPAAALHELKTTNAFRPRRFEDITVLFCDVVDFTSYCDQNSPEVVVRHLQELIDLSENVSNALGLEKIKTVGDAFIATAGLFQHVDRPEIASLQAGFEIIAGARRQQAGWSVRIGLHRGALVGGIIGRQHRSFDIWGDTVNTAARIAAQADPNTIAMSNCVWRALDGKYQGLSMGLVTINGKEPMDLIQCRPMDASQHARLIE